MKTQIVRLFATLSLLLTCFLGTALAQGTNTPTLVHNSQRYNHKDGGSVTYYIVIESSDQSYSNADLNSWGSRMLDSIDKEFGNSIFKLKVPDHPTPREKQIAVKDFLPRASAVITKWLKEQELEGSLTVKLLDFEIAGSPQKRGRSDLRGSTSGIGIGR